jgi:hypothetical protein
MHKLHLAMKHSKKHLARFRHLVHHSKHHGGNFGQKMLTPAEMGEGVKPRHALKFKM